MSKSQRSIYKKYFENPNKILQTIYRYFLYIHFPILLSIIVVIQINLFNILTGLAYYIIIRASIITFGVTLFLFSFSIFLKKKYSYIYLALVSFIISGILISQFLYYSYSQSFLQGSYLKDILYIGALQGAIKAYITPAVIVFIINIPVIISIIILHKKYKEKLNFDLKIKEKIIIFIISLFVLISSIGYVTVIEIKEIGRTDLLFSKVFDSRLLVQKIGILNYSFEEVYKFIVDKDTPSNEDIKLATNWVNNKKEITTKNGFGIAKNKNLIFIQLESFENFPINRKIDEQEITPNFNKFLNDGIYFSNYYYQIGTGTTADAEFSTLNSLYPLPNKVVFFEYPHNDYYALPRLLVDNGYNTNTYHGDSNTFWNRVSIYPYLGYQHQHGKEDFKINKAVGWGLSDEDLFNQTLQKLKKLPQPFMSTIITLTSHTPYELPSELNYLHISDKNNLTKLQTNYLKSINYVDKNLGKFINNLKKEGLYDNSIIVLVGDHSGFISNETDKNFANFLGLKDFDKLSYLQNNQVPLLIISPNTNLKGVTNKPTSHIDLYPTLANLLGLNTPKSIVGQDVLNTNTPIFTKRRNDGIDTIITDKLVYFGSSDGEFNHGSCKSLPEQMALPVNKCLENYNNQIEILKVSDILIKGNLINKLK